MKPSSKEILEKISAHCDRQMVFYRYNKNTLKVSDKYREGRLCALEYIAQLSGYYLQEEKRLEHYFREQVHKQMRLHSCLEDTAYKQGLYDALNEILDHQKECKERKER